MRSFRNVLYFTLGVMIALVWGIKSASAQGVIYNSPSGPIPTEVVGPFSSWSAGMKAAPSAVSANGVSLRATGIATTTLSNGARIGSTVAATGEIISPRIAALTAGFIKWGRVANPAIVAGSIAYAVYKESGYQTCPPPDFFCKPGDAGAPAPGYNWQGSQTGVYSPDAVEACRKESMYWRGDEAWVFQKVYNEGKSASCGWTPTGPAQVVVNLVNPGVTNCASPNVYNSSTGSCSAPASPAGPYTDAELEQAMLDKMRAEPAFAKKYWDAVLSDSLANPGYKPVGDFVNADTPINAEPITPTTTPPQVVKKETVQNSDGTTSTTTTTAETTVQPKIEGGTAGTAKVTADSTTKYTTTTVNNTTNQTTTNTSTVTNNTTEQKKDDSFVDSGMPEVPSLYTQKYPDGLAGAWRDYKPDVSSTSFFTGVKGMFPDFGGGSCPSFALPLTIGSLLHAGTVPFNVPCYIYGFVGLCMLITAAFTARKIIF